MNNLHRELAPVSAGAWAQIEEEATRTLKRYLGARQIVDLHGPMGFELSAIGTGHLHPLSAALAEGVECAQREVNALVELRVPFELTRAAVDDVERGSNDSDWQPLKDAARQLASAEDQMVFLGYADAGIEGILPGTSNAVVKLPGQVADYPKAVAGAINALHMAGVNGPYALVLGTESFTKATGGDEGGYPVLEHLKRLVDAPVIWSQALEGGVVVTTRGGDFDLWLGQDISIGYLSHTAETMTLYLQESLTFQMQTSEAVVVLES